MFAYIEGNKNHYRKHSALDYLPHPSWKPRSIQPPGKPQRS